ncbi:unnamed protein product [Amoebophrya sp. A120]|nr:unnamed protein product [Amoebophrya sp. A120]|eukprot:GSA120T00008147001.1
MLKRNASGSGSRERLSRELSIDTYPEQINRPARSFSFDRSEPLGRSLSWARSASRESLDSARETNITPITPSAHFLFGTKNIGWWGGIAIIVNTTVGAGLAQIPLVFVQGGWLIPGFLVLAFSLLSGLASVWLCECIRFVPGNEYFNSRVEFISCTQNFIPYPNWFVKVTAITLFGALQTLNVVSIVTTAQGIDGLILELTGRNCGFSLDFASLTDIDSSRVATGLSNGFGLHCIQKDTDSLSGKIQEPVNTPFVSPAITEGYLVCCLLAVPLAIVNMEDNVPVQVVTFIFCFCTFALWVYDLLCGGTDGSGIGENSSSTSAVMVGTSAAAGTATTSTTSSMNAARAAAATAATTALRATASSLATAATEKSQQLVGTTHDAVKAAGTAAVVTVMSMLNETRKITTHPDIFEAPLASSPSRTGSDMRHAEDDDPRSRTLPEHPLSLLQTRSEDSGAVSEMRFTSEAASGITAAAGPAGELELVEQATGGKPENIVSPVGDLPPSPKVKVDNASSSNAGKKEQQAQAELTQVAGDSSEMTSRAAKKSDEDTKTSKSAPSGPTTDASPTSSPSSKSSAETGKPSIGTKDTTKTGSDSASSTSSDAHATVRTGSDNRGREQQDRHGSTSTETTHTAHENKDETTQKASSTSSSAPPSAEEPQNKGRTAAPSSSSEDSKPKPKPPPVGTNDVHEVETYFKTDPFGDGKYSQLMGTVLSNFAVCMIIPSWLNEKSPEVSVSRSVWFSMSLCTVIYLTVGILGAAFFGHLLSEQANFLTVMIHRTNSFLVRFTCYTFPLVAALTGVPLCSIVCRYNLLEQELCETAFVANIWAIALPWTLAIPLQTWNHGEGTQDFLNYGSLLFCTFVNFVVPFIVFLKYNEVYLTNEAEGYLEMRSSLHDRSSKAHWGLPHKWISRERMQQVAQFCLAFTTVAFVVSFFDVITQGLG